MVNRQGGFVDQGVGPISDEASLSEVVDDSRLLELRVLLRITCRIRSLARIADQQDARDRVHEKFDEIEVGPGDVLNFVDKYLVENTRDPLDYSPFRQSVAFQGEFRNLVTINLIVLV